MSALVNWQRILWQRPLRPPRYQYNQGLVANIMIIISSSNWAEFIIRPLPRLVDRRVAFLEKPQYARATFLAVWIDIRCQGKSLSCRLQTVKTRILQEDSIMQPEFRVSESTLIHPLHNFGIAKFFFERLITKTISDSVILRLSNVFGYGLSRNYEKTGWDYM